MGRGLGCGGGASVSGISAPMKVTPESSPPLPPLTAQGEDAICEPGVGLSPEPRYEVTLILDVQPAELHCEKDVSVVYKPTGLW